MTFTKYIYSILLAVTIGLLLLFFVPALKDNKNDKIVYNYEVIERDFTIMENYNLASLNGDKQYIVYLSIYYNDEYIYEKNTFMVSLNFPFFQSFDPSGVGISFGVTFQREVYDYSLFINFFSHDYTLININYNVLIIEVA